MVGKNFKELAKKHTQTDTVEYFCLKAKLVMTVLGVTDVKFSFGNSP